MSRNKRKFTILFYTSHLSELKIDLSVKVNLSLLRQIVLSEHCTFRVFFLFQSTRFSTI